MPLSGRQEKGAGWRHRRLIDAYGISRLDKLCIGSGCVICELGDFPAAEMLGILAVSVFASMHRNRGFLGLKSGQGSTHIVFPIAGLKFPDELMPGF